MYGYVWLCRVLSRNLCCGTVKGYMCCLWLLVCIYSNLCLCAFEYVHYLKLTGAPERPCNPNSPIGPGTPFETNNTDKTGRTMRCKRGREKGKRL